MGGTWPKKEVELTPYEREILEKAYQDVKDWGYSGVQGWLQNMGHSYIEKISKRAKETSRTLEIGCGRGWHLAFAPVKCYTGVDFRHELLLQAKSRFHDINFLQADINNLPFPDATFDRVLSIYVFEHLHHLPRCLSEIERVLKPGGELMTGLPAEGGLAYDIGRRLTTKRDFEKKYKVDYLKLVRAEHCNSYDDVIAELEPRFSIDSKIFLPFFIPSIHLSAVVVLRCTKSREKAS